MTSEELVQGSPEWLAIRVGKVTASRIDAVLAKGGVSRASYRNQLVAERLTGMPCGSFFTTEAMARGTAEEPGSRLAYAALTGNVVTQVGFCQHPTIQYAGASPDGLVGEDGLLELKNPNSETQVGYVLDDEVPKKYIAQMQWQMACTGRKWCDFFSYDSRLKGTKYEYFLKRVERNELWISMTEAAVLTFLDEVEELVKEK